MSFNSLQTGKRIQSGGRERCRTKSEVSIPFKRESVSKEAERRIKSVIPHSFNSLQTGKRIQRLPGEEKDDNESEFQFPSNGKAYPKIALANPETVGFIKFQFPSNGKAYPKVYVPYISSTNRQFQFPSNGKAYPKEFLSF